MNKNGNTLVAGLVIFAAIVAALFVWNNFGDQVGSVIVPSDNQANLIKACGDDQQSTVTLFLSNGENSTADEQFAATYYLSGNKGDWQTGATDGDGVEDTLNCGEEYTLSFIRADADGGDNSKIDNVLLATGARVVDGQAIFTPGADRMSLKAVGSKHGTLEFKAYDNANAGWMCDSDVSCTAYEADGVSFESTTNGTALAVGSGGEIDITLTARADSLNQRFSDYYTLILVEAPVATWNEPTVKVDGTRLTDVKGSLTSHEEKQFSGYEYVYKYNGVINYDGVDVDFHMTALAGQDPSVDPEIDFASGGNYLSIDGVTVKRGAADDTSSAAVVFTVQDVTIDIS